MTEIVSYKSLVQFNVILVIGTALSGLLGYFIVPQFLPIASWDWISILAIFVGLPVLLAAVVYYYGWRYKRQVVIYNPPEWNFDPVLMTVDEAKKLPREYNQLNFRLVADSKFWMFFTPVILLVLIPSIPVFSYLEDPGIIEYSPLIFGILFALLYSITQYGSFKSTSNTASGDFTLPLIREVVKLAKIQEKIEGVSKINVVLDKAEHGDFAIYDQPRVLIRISGIEKDGYIESWSDDLDAITRVLVRIYETEDKPQVVWWWTSTDRNFRKYIHPDELGYYVKNPLKTKIAYPGVKDVRLVTETAVVLMIQEYIKTRKESETLQDIIDKINAEYA